LAPFQTPQLSCSRLHRQFASNHSASPLDPILSPLKRPSQGRKAHFKTIISQSGTALSLSSNVLRPNSVKHIRMALLSKLNSPAGRCETVETVFPWVFPSSAWLFNLKIVLPLIFFAARFHRCFHWCFHQARLFSTLKTCNH